MKRNDIVMPRTDEKFGDVFRVLKVRVKGMKDWAYLTPLGNGPKGKPVPVRTNELELVGVRVAAGIKTELVHMLRHKGPNKIERRFREGVGANEVKGFSDLHEFMDANMLGDYESILDLDVDARVAVDIQSNSNMTEDEALVQTRFDILEAAHSEVDRWIKEGGLTKP